MPQLEKTYKKGDKNSYAAQQYKGGRKTSRHDIRNNTLNTQRDSQVHKPLQNCKQINFINNGSFFKQPFKQQLGLIHECNFSKFNDITQKDSITIIFYNYLIFVIFVLLNKQTIMQLVEVRIKMNDKLFLRNPEDSVLGKKIVKQGLQLINKLGFEDFTFKKLALEVDTTEASIYRYFENKHKLLLYLITWYWGFLEYKVIFSINNINDAELKLRMIIKTIAEEPAKETSITDFISEYESYKLLIWEGSKSYLTRHVGKDNKDRLFKPYKDLCERFSSIIKEYNPKYKFPHSLASTILEMAHSQKFFKQNLPSLTDFPKETDDKKIILFLESLLFSSLDTND